MRSCSFATILIAFLSIISNSANAQTVPPMPPEVKVVSVMAPFDQMTVKLERGEPQDCQQLRTDEGGSSTTPNGGLVSCRVVGGSMIVEDPQQQRQDMVISLERLVYSHTKSHDGGATITDWAYTGTWAREVMGIGMKSKAVLVVLDDPDHDNQYLGDFRLADHDLNLAVKMAAR